ncbi:MAG TPA: hypothetical protein VKD26_05895 [Streptosporangiaceae bacterium]|nr:hypothetical protein [Streptosporangiaceae bacterium]
MTMEAQRARCTAELQHSYLEALAAELSGYGFRATLHSPAGRIPSLHVVNPAASVLAENIFAACGRDDTWWFWWSWAERIAIADDVARAAARVARVLAAPHDQDMSPGTAHD